MTNEQQREYWNETGGPVWLEREADLAEASVTFTQAALDAAAVQPGERILDVGCGTGLTTMELALLAGDSGSALGFDISALLVDRAKEKASAMPNVDFAVGDAQTFAFDGSFDVVFSQFGIMFFEDPVAAFANLRTALKPTGRLTFMTWCEPPSQQWQMVPLMAVASVLGGFEPPPAGEGPPGPGPFAFADPARIEQVLGDADYSDIVVKRLDTEMRLPVEKLDTFADFVGRMGPLGDPYKAADDETKQRAIDAVREATAKFVRDGRVVAPGAAWIVTARQRG